jgi:hypothetical protein
MVFVKHELQAFVQPVLKLVNNSIEARGRHTRCEGLQRVRQTPVGHEYGPTAASGRAQHARLRIGCVAFRSVRLVLMWRSLLAVLAGWAAIQALVLATDAVLVRLFPRQYGAGAIPRAAG